MFNQIKELLVILVFTLISFFSIDLLDYAIFELVVSETKGQILYNLLIVLSLLASFVISCFFTCWFLLKRMMSLTEFKTLY